MRSGIYVDVLIEQRTNRVLVSSPGGLDQPAVFSCGPEDNCSRRKDQREESCHHTAHFQNFTFKPNFSSRPREMSLTTPYAGPRTVLRFWMVATLKTLWISNTGSIER
jgi:hypothetical protein